MDKYLDVYKRTNNLLFGLAMQALKKGCKVARKSWNDKNLWVIYRRGYPNGRPYNKQTAATWYINEGESFVVHHFLQLRTANGSHVMWMPSASDALAEDWLIVE